MLQYEIVLTAANGAVRSHLLAGQPAARDAIKAASQTATAAVFAFDDVTRGCLRDPTTREIVLVPGKLCEPDRARALLPTAVAAITTLQSQLIERGLAVEDSP